MHRRWIVIPFLFFLIHPNAARSQESVPLPPLLGSDSESKNSLMDILKGDLLRQYQNALAKDKEDGAKSSRRPGRPRTELGRGQYSEEPIDISKLVGTEGDSKKTIEKLRELGKIPYPQDAALPESASGTKGGIWDDVPPEKRYAYAQDLFERRKYDQAQRELERFLSENPTQEERFPALMLREKCLYHRRFYETVQGDYYKLKSYFPQQEKAIEEIKQYFEEKSGVATLQKKVFANPIDAAAQHDLLSLYTKLDWLDFGEEFFLKTIRDTSAVTAKSLCEIYYKKQDYEMLVALSKAAYEMHSNETSLLYNEAVGLYMLGDPASRERALELFHKVSLQAIEPHLRKNAQWYINRLSPKRR